MRRLPLGRFAVSQRQRPSPPLCRCRGLEDSTPATLLLSFAVAVLLASVVLLAASAHAAPPGEKPIREIFVPFDDLNVLLQGDVQRTFLTRDEYEDLLAKAKQTPAERAPLEAVLLSADYDTTIQQQRAAIRGQLWIEVLEPGLHAVPLELSGVGIRAAMLDGEPASLGRNDQGQVLLLVEGVGQRQLELDLVTVLQTSAAQQSLHFTLPTPAATKMHVTVPGNVEVRSGAAVVSRSVDPQAGVTRFELLPQRGPLSLVMSLNNKLLLEQRVVMARSVIVDEMTQGYERLHATVSFEVLHGAVDEFRFRIPAGFEVTDVNSPTLARWLVNDDAGDRILDVDLREPTTGTVVLNISAVNNLAAMRDWQMPRLEPLDIASHAAVVGVLSEDRLAVDSIAASGLIAIDNDVLPQALPESVFRVEPGAPQVRPVIAYYAPQDQYQLTARFTRPAARVDVHTNMLLTLGEKQQHAQGTITLVPSNEKLFTVDIAVPDGWRVAALRSEDGSPIHFERIASAGGGPARLHVKLPAGVPPSTAAKLTIEATSAAEGWLDDWSNNTASFPVFGVEGAASTTGAIAVESRDDLQARPDQLNGLSVLGDKDRASLGLEDVQGTLLYRITDADYAASFAVERLQPRITARVFSFLKIEPQGLAAHYELIYDVQQARSRELRFQLPESTPASLSVRGLGGTRVKEYSSELVDGQRQWRASLAEPAIGQVRLAVDFEQPLEEDEPQDWELPLVQALEVAYQSALVAVEGSPEFDAQVHSNGRKIDVGELVDAEHQVGQRLWGAFGFVGDPRLTVDVHQRPGYGLPAAITQRAELVTLVAASGNSHTAARYLLRTKAAFLQISLPNKAVLWSATVDGKPAAPQRDGDDLVVSLPPTAAHALRDLRIVYETETNSIEWMADIETDAPRLVVRTDAGGDRYEVPTADVLWHLVLPAGHRMVRSHGTVFTDDWPRRYTSAGTLGKLLYRLGGGVGEFGILPGLSSARRARPMSTAYSVGSEAREMSDAEQLSVTSEMYSSPAAQTTLEMPPQEAAEPQSAPSDVPDQPAPSFRDGLDVVDRLQQADSLQSSRVASGGKYWALQGVRSLQIELERSGQQVRFQSMGERPRLQATLVHADRLTFLSWVLAIITAAWGVAKTTKSVRAKTLFVLTASGLALALPLVIGLLTGLELAAVFEPMLVAALLLAVYYPIAGVVRWLASTITARRPRAAAVTTAVVLLVAMSGAPAFSQGERGDGIDPAELLLLLQGDKPVKLPDDAVIIPYDAADENGVEKAEKVLVPYAEYTRLWNLAFPDQPLDAALPPAPYAMADAAYTATLDGEGYLLVRGQMELAVYQQSPIEIPLHLAGGVLERAALDGEPARLRIIAPNPAGNTAPDAQLQQAAQVREAAAEAFAMLHISSPGRKRLELDIRLPIARSGGWRIVRGQLPTAPATKLTLAVPNADTELRLSGTFDRASFETRQANQSIATALPNDGGFALQWRPAVAAAQVDQTLTARSLAVLDIQEDGTRLAWRIELQTRDNQRETFSFVVPQEYLVEQVQGENVRGWQSRASGDQQQIDVTLLKPATGTEIITLRLSRRSVIGLDGPTELTAPAVVVPDAVLHQGQLAIRRSPLLDVRTVQASGLSRVEIAAETLASLSQSLVEQTPLGLKPFEAYRFGAATFELALSAQAYASQIAVEERTILRIGERETSLESRMSLTIADRPVHQLEIVLPDGFDLTEVVVPGSFDWAITSVEGQRWLTVYLAAGAIGTLDLDLRGAVPRQAGDAVTNPRFLVRNAVQQTGYVVVQVDPSSDVSASQKENVDEVPLATVASWLADSQRALARLVLFHRTADYGASFQITPREPTVSSQSITNVRVTPREIEELVFLKFSIRDAGIRAVSFLLPESLRNSRITVPLLRQKTITPVADDPGQVRVQLELQDQVMDELIVLIQNSRSLTSNGYTAPLPVIETGITQFRYVVIESAGRDEVVVTNRDGFLELNRQLSQWKQLAQMLPGNITQAYVASDTAVNPQLSIATRQRAAVETAGASIGIAQTLLLVDANGAYRGVQEYRVDNKTEQFLEVQLPEQAELWTVLVAGETVKPTVVPNAPGRGRVRVPLIKTQTGDLDYPVILKYGGDLNRFRTLREIGFPLLRTVNINVQQSHVRLRLPESLRWFNFSGSMRQVTDAGELAADFVAYQTKQFQRLMQVINSDSYDSFSRVRATSNVKKQLGLALHHYHDTFQDLSGSVRLQRELQSNAAVVEQAKEQLSQSEQSPSVEMQPGNTFRLKQLYESQSINRATDVVSELESNFAAAPAERGEAPGNGQQRFNEKWFFENRLGKAADKKESLADSRIAGRAEKAPASKPNLTFEADFLKSKTAEDERKEAAVQEGSAEGVSQLERYQQRLESLESQNGSQQLGRLLGDLAESEEERDAARRRSNAQRMAGRGGAGGFGGGGFAAPSDDFDVLQGAERIPASAGETGLASLDVALPERGIEYLFTTPRGDVEITARSVSTAQVKRTVGLLGILAAVAALIVAYRVGCAIVASISRRVLVLLMILLGVVSLVGGVLPVLGILLIAGSIVIMIRSATSTQPAAT